MKYIPLARVQFREAVACPGTTEPGKPLSYPTHEEVVMSTQVKQASSVRARQCYELWDDGRGWILVTHPTSGETERFPYGMVKQVRRLDEVRHEEQGE